MLFVCVNAPYGFAVLQNLGYKHWGGTSTKANCFPQNLWKMVYLVPAWRTHWFSLWFLFLAFELVKLFTPPYPSSSRLKTE